MESMGGVKTRVQSMWRCGRWLTRRIFRQISGDDFKNPGDDTFPADEHETSWKDARLYDLRPYQLSAQ
jgi:hypothetical protein